MAQRRGAASWGCSVALLCAAALCRTLRRYLRRDDTVLNSDAACCYHLNGDAVASIRLAGSARIGIGVLVHWCVLKAREQTSGRRSCQFDDRSIRPKEGADV